MPKPHHIDPDAELPFGVFSEPAPLYGDGNGGAIVVRRDITLRVQQGETLGMREMQLEIDLVVINEQISLLRRALTNRNLTSRQRFLLVNMIGLLSRLKTSGEDSAEDPEARAS